MIKFNVGFNLMDILIIIFSIVIYICKHDIMHAYIDLMNLEL
jgi:hypothetical protein